MKGYILQIDNNSGFNYNDNHRKIYMSTLKYYPHVTRVHTCLLLYYYYSLLSIPVNYLIEDKRVNTRLIN